MKSVKFLAVFVPVKTSEAVIREIAIQNDMIEELVVRGNDLTRVDPDLLSSCINGMGRVLLTETILSEEQVEVLFNDMNKETSLSQLDIRQTDLSNVDPVVLSKCVNNLRKVTLMKTNLSMTQIYSIIDQMKKKTSLEDLNISQNSWRGHINAINDKWWRR